MHLNRFTLAAYANYLAPSALLLIAMTAASACTDPSPDCRCEGSWEGTTTVSMACGESACIGTGLACVAGEFLVDTAACDVADAAIEPQDAGAVLSDAGTDSAEECIPDCSGRGCGGDGCGGFCGSCTRGFECRSGRCESSASCPENASPAPDGERCVCNEGYLADASCTTCELDSDADGCPEHASGPRCACDVGYERGECGCTEIPGCPEGTIPGEHCTGCIDDDDGDGCPPNATPTADGCECAEGFAMNSAGCGCEPVALDWEHPAFDPTRCIGAPMSHEDAVARWSAGDADLGAYQMVFRKRSCPDGVCGPWVEVPITDISWRTRASGIAQLNRYSGVMRLNIENGLCGHHHYLDYSTYIIGASCPGVEATLTCSPYRYPGVCRGPSSDPIFYQFLGRNLDFSGTLTNDCLRLQADVSSGGEEGQAAILVRF